MSDREEEELPSRRSTARFLTDLDLEIADASGKVLDASAQAHDVTHKGFRAETKVEIKDGTVFRFTLKVEDAEPITGQAQVAWIGQSPWGGTTFGAKIVKISWRDSRRLAANLRSAGYDFVALAGKAMRMVWWIVVVAGLNAVIFHRPDAQKIFMELVPVMIALFFLGWGLLLLFRGNGK